MAKQKKQLGILLIFMVACLLVYLGILRYSRHAEHAREDEEELVVVEIDTDAVEAFSYVADGSVCSFSRDGETWISEQEPERRLKADRINSMLKKAARVTASERLESYESLSDYGLDAPENTLTFTCGGAVTTVRIGSYNEMLKAYYLMTDGSDEVYLVDSSLPDAFSGTLDDLTEEESE